MTPFSRVYIDANVFIYLFEGYDDRAAELRSMLFAEQRSQRQFFATSELSLAETLVGAYRKSDRNLVSLYSEWTTLNRRIEVAPVDRDVLWRAAILRASDQGLKLPDAIHLGTAFATDCSHFLSGDARLGPAKEFVDLRGPYDPKAAVIEIIRPERSTLETISASIPR